MSAQILESSPRWRIVGEREILLRKLTRTIKGSSKKSATRDDGRNGRKQQQQQFWQKVGRPDRSTDVHDVHRGRAVDRSGRPLWRSQLTGRIGRPFRSTDRKHQIYGQNRSTVPVDRPGEIKSLSEHRSTGPVDRSSCLGKNLLLRKMRSSEYKSCWVVF